MRKLSQATNLFAGSAPAPHKQFKLAIQEENEQKAIEIYTSSNHGKSLQTSLDVAKPFPSKKSTDEETPLHLSSKHALPKLLSTLLEKGARASVLNSKMETCLHSVCTLTTNKGSRPATLDLLLDWRGSKNNGTVDFIPINGQNVDGDTALHLSASNGLTNCIQRLIHHNAEISIKNKNNLTCVDSADLSGHPRVGSMLELTWLFRDVGGGNREEVTYHRFTETSQARLILDTNCTSLTLTMKFVNSCIRYTVEALKESPPRAETLLMAYSWDCMKLKKEYLANSEKVLKASSLQVKKKAPAALFKNTVRGRGEEKKEEEVEIGVTIENVYIDPACSNMGPFTVLREGKKSVYTVKTVNGKTGVFPVDYVPEEKALVTEETPLSPTSHTNPKKTSLCPMCGETMLERASLEHFLSSEVVEQSSRELRCGAGHVYCVGCWSDYLLAQVTKESGVGCVNCPASNCGEALDLQWVSVLLKTKSLVNKFMVQRQRRVINGVNLKWCPVANCGLLVHINPVEHDVKKPKQSELAPSVVCANGHSFCLMCNQEAHSPCSCSILVAWQELVRQESSNANLKDPNNLANSVLHPPSEKPCPVCQKSVSKLDGCHHMKCVSCAHDFCWLCLQDWSLHQSQRSDPQAIRGFQCNLFKDKSLEQRQMALLEEGKGDDRSKEAQKVKIQKSLVFVHHYSRFHAHLESRELESKRYHEVVDRVLQALNDCKSGDMMWLLGRAVDNPLVKRPMTEVVPKFTDLSNGGIHGVNLPDFYLPREKAVAFLHSAFEELEKCRTLLRWSYPFALMELDINFLTSKGTILGRKSFRRKEEVDEFRQQFLKLQSQLEMDTESLSDIVSRRRTRGTKKEIDNSVREARSKRLELENLVIVFTTEPPKPEQKAFTPPPPTPPPVTSQQSKISFTSPPPVLAEAKPPAIQPQASARSLPRLTSFAELELVSNGSSLTSTDDEKEEKESPIQSKMDSPVLREMSNQNSFNRSNSFALRKGPPKSFDSLDEDDDFNAVPLDPTPMIAEPVGRNQVMRDPRQTDSRRMLSVYRQHDDDVIMGENPFRHSEGSFTGAPEEDPPGYYNQQQQYPHDERKGHGGYSDYGEPVEPTQSTYEDFDVNNGFLERKLKTRDRSVYHRGSWYGGTKEDLSQASAQRRYEQHPTVTEVPVKEITREPSRRSYTEPPAAVHDPSKFRSGSGSDGGSNSRPRSIFRAGSGLSIESSQVEDAGFRPAAVIDIETNLDDEDPLAFSELEESIKGSVQPTQEMTLRRGSIKAEEAERKRALAIRLQQAKEEHQQSMTPKAGRGADENNSLQFSHDKFFKQSAPPGQDHDQDSRQSHQPFGGDQHRHQSSRNQPSYQHDREDYGQEVGHDSRRYTQQYEEADHREHRRQSNYNEYGEYVDPNGSRHQYPRNAERRNSDYYDQSQTDYPDYRGGYDRYGYDQRDGAPEDDFYDREYEHSRRHSNYEEPYHRGSDRHRRHRSRRDDEEGYERRGSSKHRHQGQDRSYEEEYYRDSSGRSSRRRYRHDHRDEVDSDNDRHGNRRHRRGRSSEEEEEQNRRHGSSKRSSKNSKYHSESSSEGEEDGKKKKKDGSKKHRDKTHRRQRSSSDDSEDRQMKSSTKNIHLVPVPSQPDRPEKRMIAPKKDPDLEAYEHALLLSMQEAEYGVNMYDSLVEQDEELLQEYEAQGFTREEGTLMIFEERYGKVSNQPKNVTPSMPTLHATASMIINPREMEIREEDEPHVLRLMAQGFTREQAIEVYLERKKSPVPNQAPRRLQQHRHQPPPQQYEDPQEEPMRGFNRNESKVSSISADTGFPYKSSPSDSYDWESPVGGANGQGRNVFNPRHELTEDDEEQIQKMMRFGFTYENALGVIFRQREEMHHQGNNNNQPVSSHPHLSHAQQKLIQDQEEDDDEAEYQDLLRRGYTPEQAETYLESKYNENQGSEEEEEEEEPIYQPAPAPAPYSRQQPLPDNRRGSTGGSFVPPAFPSHQSQRDDPMETRSQVSHTQSSFAGGSNASSPPPQGPPGYNQQPPPSYSQPPQPYDPYQQQIYPPPGQYPPSVQYPPVNQYPPNGPYNNGMSMNIPPDYQHQYPGYNQGPPPGYPAPGPYDHQMVRQGSMMAPPQSMYQPQQPVPGMTRSRSMMAPDPYQLQQQLQPPYQQSYDEYSQAPPPAPMGNYGYPPPQYGPPPTAQYGAPPGYGNPPQQDYMGHPSYPQPGRGYPPQMEEQSVVSQNRRRRSEQPAKPPDQEALEIAMLISQQESEFGINMFDSLTPADEPELEKLKDLGYTSNEAIRMIFELRYRPRNPVPSMGDNRSGQPAPPTQSFNPQPYSQSNLTPPATPASAGQNSDSGNNQRPERGIQKKTSIFRSGSIADIFGTNKPKREVAHGEEGVMNRALKLSEMVTTREQDEMSRASNSNKKKKEKKEKLAKLKYKEADVKQLMTMGFSKDQAVQALIENDNRVDLAANMLLTEY